jgi:hypothetical protein
MGHPKSKYFTHIILFFRQIKNHQKKVTKTGKKNNNTTSRVEREG